MAKRMVLGRGLSSILGDVDEAYGKELGFGTSSVEEIDIDKIQTNPYQPRKHFDDESLNELADSIKHYGLIQPVALLKKDNHSYILVAGERRFRACQNLGMTSIKAFILKENEDKLRELALIENIQRANLNPIELALSYKSLIEEYKITQEELSSIIHKSRTQITNTLRLLSLSKQTQDLIASNKLSQGHAKVLVGLDLNDEKKIVDTIIGQKLSVRETENLISKFKDNSKKTDKKSDKELDLNLENELNKLKISFEKLGLKCSLNKNKLSITLNDVEKIKQLSKILN